MEKYTSSLHQELQRIHTDRFHGKKEEWEALLTQLPRQVIQHYQPSWDRINFGNSTELPPIEQKKLKSILQAFHPWRKGPFSFFGIHIDTEWRSDWKWNRLKDHIQNLDGRRVLDVGCGSGYHCWRMRGEGAKAVLGIDPNLQYWFQFRIAKHFIPHEPVFYLPLALEHFPPNTQLFDTVFSMGVLYHRRSPFEHLEELKGSLRKGGQLVLETLIVEGVLHQFFVPMDRYAQMRNVWFLPSIDTMIHWLKRCGFQDPQVIDITPTTTEEQSQTAWMRFHSLADFLDPADSSKTIEGYPAPIRAIFLARK